MERLCGTSPWYRALIFAGVVAESTAGPVSNPAIQSYSPVGAWGEEHWGGFAQLAHVKSEWLLPLPQGLTLKQTMQIGTAGLTAMFCVMGAGGTRLAN